MAITINTNQSSLLVQKSLSQSTNSLNRSIERMTTGFKINKACDDAAGYSVATNMNVKLSSLDVALDNTAMGTSLIQTASSSLDLITTHLQRIRDLSEQAANGTYDSVSRQAIQAEINQRQNEIERIISSTEYNGIKLFESSSPTPFAAPRAASGITGEFLKPVNQLSEEEALAQGYTLIKTKSDLQSIESNGSGTASNPKKYILMNDIDLGGLSNGIMTTDYITLDGNGFCIKNGSINQSYYYTSALFNLCNYISVSNLELKNVSVSSSGGSAGIALSCCSSSISNCSVVDCSIYGSGQSIGIGGGSSTIIQDCYTANTSFTCHGSTPDGVCDSNTLATNCYSTSPTTYGTQVTAEELQALIYVPPAAPAGGSGNDVSLRVGIDSTDNSIISFNTEFSCALSVNVLTSASAVNSLAGIDSVLAQVVEKQTELGAIQNRLESVSEQLNVYKLSLISSLSTVRDADIATVSSEYIKSHILQQASSSLLITANQSPSIALQLI